MKLSESKLWADLADDIKANYNSNFQLHSLDWRTRVWLGVLVKKIDERLIKLEEELKDRIIL